MKYEISQKLFAFGDDFSIRDENGRERYYVDGKAMSIGKKLSFQDESKREKVLIKQRLFRFAPTFDIESKAGVVASVRKRMMSFRPQFIIDVPGTNDYEVVGDFIGHEYTIKRDKRSVARISKRFFSLSDSYGVEISGGDPVLMLSAVIIIDLVLHKKRSTPH